MNSNNMDENKNNNGEHETELNRLVKAAFDSGESSFERPSNDDVHAYLGGSADEKQIERVMAAIEASPEFAREILAMAEDLEDWTSAETLEEAKNFEPDILPAKIREQLPPRRDEEQPESAPGSALARHWWKAAAALAAVLLAVFIVPQLFEGGLETTEWAMVQEEVQPNQLLTLGDTRGGPPKVTPPHTSEQEAAMAAYRDVLRFSGGFIKPDPDRQPLDLSQFAMSITAILIDSTGNLVAEVALPVPDGVTDTVSVWLLTLPEPKLLSATVASDTVQFVWRENFGSTGLLTVVRRQADSTFVAGPAVVVGE